MILRTIVALSCCLYVAGFTRISQNLAYPSRLILTNSASSANSLRFSSALPHPQHSLLLAGSLRIEHDRSPRFSRLKSTVSTFFTQVKNATSIATKKTKTVLAILILAFHLTFQKGKFVPPAQAAGTPSIIIASSTEATPTQTSTRNQVSERVSLKSNTHKQKKNQVMVRSQSQALQPAVGKVEFTSSGSSPHSSHSHTSSSEQQQRPPQSSSSIKRKTKRNKPIAPQSRDAFEVQHVVEEAEYGIEIEVERSWRRLARSFTGVKIDSIIMLMATSAVIPLFKFLGTSPILGFLLAGTLLGPGGFNLVNDVHMIDVLGELGIVFFLFEMGLELSLERLNAMRKDVFGLGSSTFLVTAAAGTALAYTAGGVPMAAAVTIGGSLALSSSAFVLQLLKDGNAMATRHGKASFAILLLQDLAVVPLLVIVELLGEGGAGLGRALGIAGVKAMITLATLLLFGKRVLDPVFSAVARARSEEAFLSIILTTVLLMSFVTHGIGLSDTLGAFLAGILLSETSYRYQIETLVGPFRGLLLGFFFVTVGFNIDLALVLANLPLVVGILLTMLTGKAAIISGLSAVFGLSLPVAVQTGLLTAQGGEFAFVSLGLAERSGLLPKKTAKLLMTIVALSMAATPLMAEAGTAIAQRLERSKGPSLLKALIPSTVVTPGLIDASIGQAAQSDEDEDDVEEGDDPFVFLVGYGRVGRLIADVLDRRLIRYVAVESSASRAIEAKAKGLPVYFGDATRPDILKHFHLNHARAAVITFDDVSLVNKAVLRLRKMYPTLPIIARAKDQQHMDRLQSMFDNVLAVNPVIPEDSLLLLLPFGEAVLGAVGVAAPEVDAIIEDLRKGYLRQDDSSEEHVFRFADLFRRPTASNADNNSIKDVTGGQQQQRGPEAGSAGMLGGADPESMLPDNIPDDNKHREDELEINRELRRALDDAASVDEGANPALVMSLQPLDNDDFEPPNDITDNFFAAGGDGQWSSLDNGGGGNGSLIDVIGDDFSLVDR